MLNQPISLGREVPITQGAHAAPNTEKRLRCGALIKAAGDIGLVVENANNEWRCSRRVAKPVAPNVGPGAVGLDQTWVGLWGRYDLPGGNVQRCLAQGPGQITGRRLRPAFRLIVTAQSCDLRPCLGGKFQVLAARLRSLRWGEASSAAASSASKARITSSKSYCARPRDQPRHGRWRQSMLAAPYDAGWLYCS